MMSEPFSSNWLDAVLSLDDPNRIWFYTDPYGITRRATPLEKQQIKDSLRACWYEQARQYLDRILI